MTISERLDNIGGEISIYPLAGPWLRLTLFYKNLNGRSSATMEMSGFTNMENVLDILLCEVEASIGIFQPEIMEA